MLLGGCGSCKASLLYATWWLWILQSESTVCYLVVVDPAKRVYCMLLGGCGSSKASLLYATWWLWIQQSESIVCYLVVVDPAKRVYSMLLGGCGWAWWADSAAQTNTLLWKHKRLELILFFTSCTYPKFQIRKCLGSGPRQGSSTKDWQAVQCRSLLRPARSASLPLSSSDTVLGSSGSLAFWGHPTHCFSSSVHDKAVDSSVEMRKVWWPAELREVHLNLVEVLEEMV